MMRSPMAMYTLAMNHFAMRRAPRLTGCMSDGAQGVVLRLPRDGVATHQGGQKREQEARRA